MADIRLAKPAAGAQESVQCAPDARFVFDFPTTDATLAREGDNLNISFQDGSQLQLQGFYQEYNGENLPSFNIDGTEVAAADFFQAMNEPDLMPAAGPGTGTVANGARFHEWGDSSLASGITHLNGLDWGFSRSFEWEDHPNAVGYDDDWGRVNNPVTLTPEDPSPVPPGTVIPGYDPENPVPGTPGNGGIVPPGDVRLVSESGLRDADTVSVHGAMRVSAPDGLASIEIDGRVIWQNGQMVGDPQFATDEGYFNNFAYDAATGRLTYTYTLDHATTEHKLAGPDHIAHSLPLTVRDVDGDAASSHITIIIRDDTPEIARPVHEAGNDAVTETDTGAVVANAVQDTAEAITLKLDGLTLGADDGEGKSVPQALTVEVAGQTFTFAVTTDQDGNYSFGAPQKGPGNSAMEISGNREDGYRLLYTRPDSHWQAKDADGNDVEARSDTYTFDITVKDADGDIAATSQTIRTNVTPDVDPDPENPTPPTGEDPELGLRLSDVTVNEAYLARGNKAGADEATSQTATGTFIADTHGEGGTLKLELGGKSITIKLDEQNNWSAVKDPETGEWKSPEQGSPSLDTEYGTLTVTDVTKGVVSYTYELTSPYGGHVNPDDTSVDRDTAYYVEKISVTLIDDIGHDPAKEGMLGVHIVDDVPEISAAKLVFGVGQENDHVTEKDNDGNEVKGEDGKDVVLDDAVQDTAQTITLQLDGLKFGADDGEGATLSVALKDGPTFTFDVNMGKDGNYYFGDEQKHDDDGSAMKIVWDKANGYQLVYTRPTDDVQQGEGAASDTYTFDITVKDADGDIAATSQTIRTNVTPDVDRDPENPTPPTGEDPELGLRLSDVTVNEAYLDLGNQPEGDKTTSETATGTFVVNTHGEGGTLKLELGGKSITIKLDEQDNWVVEDPETGEWKGPEEGYMPSLTTGHGTLTVTDVTKGVVSYTYELTSPYGKHVNPDDTSVDRDTADYVEKISVLLTDDIGHDPAKEGMLGVHIVDDIPVLEAIEFDNEPMKNNDENDDTQYISDSDETISGTLSGLSLGADADGGTVTLTVKVSGKEEGAETYSRTFDVKVVDGKVTLEGREGEDQASELELDDDGRFSFNRAGDADTRNETYTFTATVVDKDGDTVIAENTVVTNHAPNFFTPPENPGDDEGDDGPEPLGPGAQVAASTVHESVLPPDGSQYDKDNASLTHHEGSFGIDTHGEGGSVTFTWEGQTITYTLGTNDAGTAATDENGNPLPTSITSEDGTVTFEITGIDKGGLVQYKVTLNEALKDDGTDPKDLWNTVNLENNVEVKLTDGVNKDVATGYIKLDVVDDAPVFTPESAIPDEPIVDREHPIDNLTFNFTKINDYNLEQYFSKVGHYGKSTVSQEGPWYVMSSTNGDRPVGYVMANHDTFAITSTFVHYQYTEDNGVLSVQNVVDLNAGIYNAGKSLTFINGEGLSVGGAKFQNYTFNFYEYAWNGKGEAGDISVGTKDVNMVQGVDADRRYKLVNEYGGEEKKYNTICGANVSEAVVFDLKDDVAYGFDISLARMDPGDRVLLTFMLTPKNSNDDTIVKMVEVNSAKPGIIPVEEGFSKVIVSSVPKAKYDLDRTSNGLEASLRDEEGNTEEGSGFIIEQVRYLTALYTAHGKVEAHSADTVESYAWDWSAFEGADVHVKGINSGDYTVKVVNNVATLYGEGALNEKELFRAEIDPETGDWKIALKYEFFIKGENPGDPFKIVASEPGEPGKVDVGTQVIEIDPKFNRFSEMLTGKTTNDSTLANDIYDDRIGGLDGNSLIYGKGGDDILLGDKLQWDNERTTSEYKEVNGVLDDLKGMNIEGVMEFDKKTDDDSDDSKVVNLEEINNDFIKNVQDLDYDQKRDLGERLEELENKVDGGDDAIYGGLGNDFIFAGAGDDVILGYGKKNPWIQDDADIIYAGSGHDIIFYNYGDVPEAGLYINGGSGNDLLLGNKNMPSLTELKEVHTVDDKKVQTVDNVEVLLRATKLDSVNSLGITSHASLLTFGIALGEAGLLLDNSVWQVETREGGVTVYINREFTLENGTVILDRALELEVDGVEVYGVAVPDDSTFAEKVGTTPASAHVADLAKDGILTEVPTASGQQDGTDGGDQGQDSLGMSTMSLRGEAHDTGDTGDSGDTGDTGGTVQEWLAERIDQAESTILGAEDAPDVLIGKDVNEHIIGGAAGDFIDGRGGSDITFAGGGDDLIVYDPTDYFIDGGTGLDFLLSSGNNDREYSLDEMMKNYNDNTDPEMPRVTGVEVMIKGVDTLSLQNMDQLAEKYGFEVDHVGGRDILKLDKTKWEASTDQPEGSDTTTYVFKGGDGENVMLETSLQTDDAATQASQNIVLTSNG